ncbi:MAG: ABC transporter permease, partial [Aggregatilineales bacterium]
SLVKNRVQAQALSSAILVLFGVLGGAFFNTGTVEAPLGVASYFSPTFWGANAFVRLANGTFPVLHVVVLLGIALVTFGIGLRLFIQRVEV